MSFEGHHQFICKKGHLFQEPENYGTAKYVCHCGAKPEWSNRVDDTNCDAYGVIVDFSSLLIAPRKVQRCDLGHDHVTEEARYRIPTQAEAKALQQRWDGMAEKYIPLYDAPQRTKPKRKR